MIINRSVKGFQITGISIACWKVCFGSQQRNRQRSVLLALYVGNPLLTDKAAVAAVSLSSSSSSSSSSSLKLSPMPLISWLARSVSCSHGIDHTDKITQMSSISEGFGNWQGTHNSMFPKNNSAREMLAHNAVIILGVGSANEWRLCKVTPSLIGWAHAQNDPLYATRLTPVQMNNPRTKLVMQMPNSRRALRLAVLKM